MSFQNEGHGMPTCLCVFMWYAALTLVYPISVKYVRLQQHSFVIIDDSSTFDMFVRVCVYIYVKLLVNVYAA